MAKWRNRIVGYGEEDPRELKANPANWRIHPYDQQVELLAVLREVGVVQNVMINKATGNIVDGHLRVALAVEEGEPVIPVTYVELTEEEERRVLATYDPIGAMAIADETKLNELLQKMETPPEFGPDIEVDLTFEDQPELEISPELYERQDYLLILFDNEFDWQVACERLGVQTVRNLPVVGTSGLAPKVTGTGRVIAAKRLLRELG